MESKQIQVNGITLHCMTEGAGKLMILLHGFPEFWYSWRKQIPVLAQHFKVVAPDMRGYHRSDKPKGVYHYRPEALVNDVRDLIKAFGQEKAIIVGHDWGGAVAWWFASLYPEMTEKLIVLNMPHPAEMKKQLWRNFTQLKKSWYVFFFQLPYLPEQYLSRNPKKFFKQALRGWSINKEAFSNDDIDQYVKAFPLPSDFTAPINYYRAGARYPVRANGRKPVKVSAPTLLIFGEDDKALGKELTYNTQHYCSGILKMEYIPNCSHWVQHEHPDKVNQLILDFTL
ncbi:MAG: alpha/beta hydrolase [Sphingobacteriales bacterium]|nr:MAG: alpha/beta hydrolase [Sphingobacteriales bacterium]